MSFRVTPLLQPDETGMCGQTVVAMAADVSLTEAANAVGVTVLKVEGTTSDDLTRGLRALGLRVGQYINYRNRRKRLRRLPSFAIMCVSNRSTWAHWVLLKDGFVFDPALGWPMPVHVYELVAVEGAYSRRYRKKSEKRRNVIAMWEGVLPILSYPGDKSCPRPSPSSTASSRTTSPAPASGARSGRSATKSRTSKRVPKRT